MKHTKYFATVKPTKRYYSNSGRLKPIKAKKNLEVVLCISCYARALMGIVWFLFSHVSLFCTPTILPIHHLYNLCSLPEGPKKHPTFMHEVSPVPFQPGFLPFLSLLDSCLSILSFFSCSVSTLFKQLHLRVRKTRLSKLCCLQASGYWLLSATS